MKIENIQEEIKSAFEDKRIVVVRGGNMSHRDEIMLGLILTRHFRTAFVS